MAPWTSEKLTTRSLLFCSLRRFLASINPEKTFDRLLFSTQKTAALRALENERKDRWFSDPYAATLAGPVAMSQARAFMRKKKNRNARSRISIRTLFFDTFVKENLHEGMQLVILGAGMDARVFRMDCISESNPVFEVDTSSVFDMKRQLLRQMNRQPSSRAPLIYVQSGVSSASWQEEIITAGFKPDVATVWLLEGLINYLSEETSRNLLRAIEQISASGSTLCLSTVPKKAEQRKRYKSCMPDPHTFLTELGFSVKKISAYKTSGNGDGDHILLEDDADRREGAYIFVIAEKKQDV